VRTATDIAARKNNQLALFVVRFDFEQKNIFCCFDKVPCSQPVIGTFFHKTFIDFKCNFLVLFSKTLFD
jgi:hypothetical protein